MIPFLCTSQKLAYAAYSWLEANVTIEVADIFHYFFFMTQSQNPSDNNPASWDSDQFFRTFGVASKHKSRSRLPLACVNHCFKSD